MINDFKSAHTHAKQTRDYEPLTEMCSGFFRAIAQYVGLVDDSSSTPAAHERQFNMDRKSFLKDPRQQFLVVSYLQSVAYALRNSPIDDFIKCCRLPCLLPDAWVTWYSQRDDNHWGDVLACIEAPESTRSELSITAVCADKQIADMLERYTKVINHLPSSERKLLAARGSWFPRLPAKGDSALMWSVGSHEEVSDASAVQAVKPVSTATHTPSATSRATRAAPRPHSFNQCSDSEKLQFTSADSMGFFNNVFRLSANDKKQYIYFPREQFPVKFSSVFLLWKIQDWPALKSFIKSYPGYVTARADTPSLVYYRNQMVVEAGCKC